MAALSGIRIVSVALNVPGPVAVARLAAAGAEVVKIEPPAGDPLELLSPTWYAELTADLEIEPLDLKSAAGQARLAALLAGARLLVSSQRPSALGRLGLGPSRLAADFPALRHLNIVGDLAHPEHAGHDLTYQATRGLVANRLPDTVLADLLGAERALSAALLLLAGPAGGRAEVGLADSLDVLSAPTRHGLTGPGQVLGGGLPAYGVYAAREGHVAVAALEPHFRRRLYEALNRPIDSPLADAFGGRTARAWEDWAHERDLPIVAVRAR